MMTNGVQSISANRGRNEHIPYPHLTVRDGYIVSVKKQANGEESVEPIARAIRIKSIETNIDDNNVVYVLSFRYGNQEVQVPVARGDLTRVKLTQLLAKGADVFDDNVFDVIRHLRNEEIYAPKTTVHHQVGWGNHQGRPVFKHQQAIGVRSEYKGQLAIEPQGTYEEWANIVSSEVLGHTPLEVALVLGFSSVLVGFISEDISFGSLVGHISGDSTMGKTTAAMLAVSIAGRADTKKNGLMATWNTTQNAMMGSLRDNYGLPVVFDESSMSGIKDFSNIIYMFAEGRDKARMTKELELRDISNWRTTILSTGEHGLTLKSKRNAGLRVRIMEFSGVTWTKNAANAERIKEGVTKNHGHAAPMLAEHILKLGKSEVLKRFDYWKKQCLVQLEDTDRFAPRIAAKLAVLMTTASLVNEVFKFGLDIDELLTFFAANEKKSVEDRDIYAKAYNYLLEQVAINHHRFSCKHGDITKGIPEFEFVEHEHWGMRDYIKDGSMELVVTTSAFNAILREGGFEDPKIILRGWKQRDLLNCEKDRLTRKRKLLLNGPPMDLYVIKIPKEVMEEAEESAS